MVSNTYYQNGCLSSLVHLLEWRHKNQRALVPELEFTEPLVVVKPRRNILMSDPLSAERVPSGPSGTMQPQGSQVLTA